MRNKILIKCIFHRKIEILKYRALLTFDCLSKNVKNDILTCNLTSFKRIDWNRLSNCLSRMIANVLFIITQWHHSVLYGYSLSTMFLHLTGAKTRCRCYFYEIPCYRGLFDIPTFNIFQRILKRIRDIYCKLYM